MWSWPTPEADRSRPIGSTSPSRGRLAICRRVGSRSIGRRHVRARTRPEPGVGLYRVVIAAGDQPVGSIWATRARAEGHPDGEETRLLSLAADQVGLAFRRERLTETANAAEIARQSEALKGALLDSVSHGFRTPLASIRAAAGSLLDPEVAWTDEERRDAARTIDAEAERLNVLVRNLLDMSRIEAGELRPQPRGARRGGPDHPVVERVSRALGRPPVQIVFGPDLPPIRADAEPVRRGAREPARERCPLCSRRRDPRERGSACPDGRVRVRVEDAGPGVPAASLRTCSTSSTACRGRARAPGAGSGSVSGSSRASRWPWAARWPRAPARSVGSLWTSSSTPRPSRRSRPAMRRHRGRTLVTADHASGPHILLVEDDGSTRSLVAANLEAHGYQVRAASTAADAVRSWDAQRPDLVVLDLGLPDADGPTVIRARPTRRHDTDPRPVGAGGGAGQGGGPGAGRRRLRHEAVRSGGAARAGGRVAASGGRTGRRHDRVDHPGLARARRTRRDVRSATCRWT